MGAKTIISKSIERQRTIKRVLSDGVRSKVRTKIEHVFSYNVRNYIDAETQRDNFVLNLKSHLRWVCIWLEWIETGEPGPLAVQHAINQTRHVSD